MQVFLSGQDSNIFRDFQNGSEGLILCMEKL